MIYEKDYIMRLILLMGEILRRLKQAATEKLFDAGLDAFLRDQSGLSLRTALSLDAAALGEITDLRGRLAIAMALQTKAERPHADKLSLEEKALRLLTAMADEPEICRGMADTVYALLLDTADGLDSRTIMDAAVFLREAGQLDRMDSAAFFLWEGLPERDRDAWRPGLMGLYAPLSALTADELARGGLSKEEWNESLRAFGGGNG